MCKNFQIRKTFALKTDFLNLRDDKSLVCEPFYTKLELKNALKMSSRQIFLYLANEIKENSLLFDTNSKYLAILSFTRYNPNEKIANDIFENTQGYCAIGKSLNDSYSKKN